jgi:Dockerin type I domain
MSRNLTRSPSAQFSGRTSRRAANRPASRRRRRHGPWAPDRLEDRILLASLVVTTQPPAYVIVGAGFGLTITAENPSGSVDTSFDGPVTVALSGNPGGATLAGTLTVTAQSGVATFSGLTLNQPGTGYALDASSPGLTGATTDAFDAQTTLLVNGNFSAGNTGFTSQYVYSTDLGPEGNYVVGSDPQTYNSGGASFGDHTTGTGLMLIANGAPTANTYVWQENVNVATGTSYVFSGWAASWGELNGDLTDPSPAQLEFFVNGVQVGSEFTLNAHDGDWTQFSASWTSGTSSVATVTIVDENLTLTGNDFCLDDLGFGTVGPAYPLLAVTTQPPSSVVAGSDFGLTVTAYSGPGDVDSSFDGTVDVGLLNNPGGGTLGGTLTATAKNGVATFSDLTLTAAADGYTLTVSANGVASGTTDAFDVTAAAVTQLVITDQPPSDVLAGGAFGLTVAAEDQYNNVNTSFDGTVAVALSSNPGGATLGGTLSATARSGTATFFNLVIDQAGAGYTLEVSTSGLNPVTTDSFNVQTTVNSSVSVSWGTSDSDTLQTASDGLRLLPAGRNNDMPWLGIDKMSITLAQATSLSSGDVTVSSAIGVDYGPVTVSGSGTSYTLTLAQPINQADRVTISIGNATIATFTRRLDVLPGDFNDDGVVNSQDLVGVRNEWLRSDGAVPTIFGDINGDGQVNGTDYNDVRQEIGTSLPAVSDASVSGVAVAGGLPAVVRIGTSGPASGGAQVVRQPAGQSSPRAEIRLAARGSGWSLGSYSKPKAIKLGSTE